MPPPQWSPIDFYIRHVYIPWRCHSMIYAFLLCNDYHLMFPVVWFLAAYCDAIIIFDKLQQKLPTSGKDIDLRLTHSGLSHAFHQRAADPTHFWHTTSHALSMNQMLRSARWQDMSLGGNKAHSSMSKSSLLYYSWWVQVLFLRQPTR